MIDVPTMARTRDIGIARDRKGVREGQFSCVHEIVPRVKATITVDQEIAGDTVTAIIWVTSVENQRSGQVGGRTMLCTLENFWEQRAVSEALHGSAGVRYATPEEIEKQKAEERSRLDLRIADAKRRGLSRRYDAEYGRGNAE